MIKKRPARPGDVWLCVKSAGETQALDTYVFIIAPIRDEYVRGVFLVFNLTTQSTERWQIDPNYWYFYLIAEVA